MAGDRLDVSFNPSDDEIWVENRDFFHTYKYLALKYVGVAHWNVPKVSDMRMIQFHKLPNSVCCSMTGSVVLTGQQHVTDRQTDGPDRYRSATVTRGKSQIPLYAILVADRFEAGRRAGQIPARCRSATSFGPVCDKDSVMEFGLNNEDASAYEHQKRQCRGSTDEAREAG